MLYHFFLWASFFEIHRAFFLTKFTQKNWATDMSVQLNFLTNKELTKSKVKNMAKCLIFLFKTLMQTVIFLAASGKLLCQILTTKGIGAEEKPQFSDKPAFSVLTERNYLSMLQNTPSEQFKHLGIYFSPIMRKLEVDNCCCHFWASVLRELEISILPSWNLVIL